MTVNASIYEFHQPGFVGSRLIRCSLMDAELVVETKGRQTLRVPYQNIVAMYLSSRGHGRNESLMHIRDFRCRVTTHQQAVEIPNRSKRGIGHPYRYQNQAFNGFVQELHRRLVPFKERVQFHSGNKQYFVLMVIFAWLITIVLPFRLYTYGERHIVYALAVYLSVSTGAFITARRLRPGSYSPTNIPEKLLPPGKDHWSFID